MIEVEFIPNLDEQEALENHIRTAESRFMKAVKEFYGTVHEGDFTAIGQTLSDFKFYPPPVPQTRYQRTFNLKRSWKIEPIVFLTRGLIIAYSDVDYAPKVMGPRSTAFFASRGWVRTDMIAEGNHSQSENELMELWSNVTIEF